MSLKFKIVIKVGLFLLVSLTSLGYYLGKQLIDKNLKETLDENKRVVTELLVQFQEYEKYTTTHLKNAVEYLALYDKQYSIESNEQLIKFKDKLGVSDAFIIDEKGKFRYATNGPPENQPDNFFGLCEGYKGLLTGEKTYEETPMLIAHPSQEVYKFVMIPNHNKKRILEVGLKIDYISESLNRALKRSDRLKVLNFYTPTGLKLGSTDVEEGKSFGLLNKENTIIDSNLVVSEQKLWSNRKNCCECRIKNLVSGNNDYFYVVQSVMSLDGHHQYSKEVWIKLSIYFMLLFVSVASIILFFAEKLSTSIKRVTSNISKTRLSAGIRSLPLSSSDDKEVYDLKEEINSVMKSYKASLEELNSIPQLKNLKSILKRIDHDIRGALDSFKISMEQSEFKSSVNLNSNYIYMRKRIIGILDDLPMLTKIDDGKRYELYSLVVEEALSNFQRSHNIKIKTNDVNGIFPFVMIDHEVSKQMRILNNLISNSIESCLDSNVDPRIEISVRILDGGIEVSILDNGKGFPEDFILEKTTKEYGTGVGLKGSIDLLSEISGTLEYKNKKIGDGAVVSFIIPFERIVFTLSCLNIQDHELVLVDDEKVNYINFKNKFSRLDVVYYKSFQSDIGANNYEKTWLIDYAFEGSENGLTQSKSYPLKGKKILYSSIYWSEKVLSESSESGFLILPKSNINNVSSTRNVTKILYLDDDELSLLNLEKYFESSGIIVDTVSTKKEFWNSFNLNSDCLYLLDSSIEGEDTRDIFKILTNLNLNVLYYSGRDVESGYTLKKDPGKVDEYIKNNVRL